MRRAISTYVHVKERLHPGMLDSMVSGGAEAIEIFGSRGHFNYTDRAHIREIGNWFRSTGVTFHSMHSPMRIEEQWERSFSPPLNIASAERRERIEAMDEIKRAIEVAEQAPYRFLVQHVGVGNESFSERKIEAAMTSLEHLRAFSKPLGVELLVENIPNELSTPEKLMELLRLAHFDDIGICFDLGHAHLADGVAASFAILKERIRSTHVHDNAKDRDSHLWPGEGSIDWAEAMSLLRSAPQVPPLLFEVEGEEGVKVAEKLAATYRKLEEVVAVPKS